MSLRQLTDIERDRLKRLTAESIDFTLIQPTATALGKSIMDATAAVRNYLREAGLHDYDQQGRGAADHGAEFNALLLGADAVVATTASLYKPEAKPKRPGDPRIWFYKLKQFARADDMLAIVAHEGKIAVINVTTTDIDDVLDSKQRGPLWEFITEVRKDSNKIAAELLEKLRRLTALGFVPSVMEVRADTAIGRTLESALGIAMNSKKQPDYKGIELKSYRQALQASRENRKQLFAKVPNWSISKFSSMNEILSAFGYFRDGRDRLNCTVSAANVNSQGLTFKVDEKAGILNETSTDPAHGAFASWYMSDLRQALVDKHSETFWIGAKVHPIDGREHFEFTNVLHTRKPIVSQLDVLIEQGEVTMDHMMKRLDSGKAHERGPSFKVASRSLELLFPPSKAYSLSAAATTITS